MADYTTEQLLDLIRQYESGGQNIINYKNKEDPKKYTAGGPYQILDSNWLKYGPKVGIDTKKFPTAISAKDDAPQRKVAKYILENTPEGIHNWTDYNDRLRAALSDDKKASPFGGVTMPQDTDKKEKPSVPFSVIPGDVKETGDDLSGMSKPQLRDYIEQHKDEPGYADLYKEFVQPSQPSENWAQLFNPEKYPHLTQNPVENVIEDATGLGYLSRGTREMGRGLYRAFSGQNPPGAPPMTSPGYAGAADVGEGALEIGKPIGTAALALNPELWIPGAIAMGVGTGGGMVSEGITAGLTDDKDKQRYAGIMGNLGFGGLGWEGSRFPTAAMVKGMRDVPSGMWQNPYVRAAAKSYISKALGHPYIGAMLGLDELRRSGEYGQRYADPRAPKAPEGTVKPPQPKFMTPQQMVDSYVHMSPDQRADYEPMMQSNLTGQGFSPQDAATFLQTAKNKAAKADAEIVAKSTPQTPKTPQVKIADLDRFLKSMRPEQRAASKNQYMNVLINQGYPPEAAEMYYNTGVAEAYKADQAEQARQKGTGPTAQQINQLKDMIKSGTLDSNVFRRDMAQWMTPQELDFHVQDALGQRFSPGPQAQVKPPVIPSASIPTPQPSGRPPNPMGGFNQPLGETPNPAGEVGPLQTGGYKPLEPPISLTPEAAPKAEEPKLTLVDRWVNAMVDKGMDPEKMDLKNPQVAARVRHDLDLGKLPKPDKDAMDAIVHRARIIRTQAEMNPNRPKLRSEQLEITPPERGEGGRITKQGKVKINWPVQPPPF